MHWLARLSRAMMHSKGKKRTTSRMGNSVTCDPSATTVTDGDNFLIRFSLLTPALCVLVQNVSLCISR